MILNATCATIAAVLASVQPGDTVNLEGDCDRIKWPRKVFEPPVTVNAHNATVRGLEIEYGGGVKWIGGTIKAPASAFASGRLGYGVTGMGAKNVTIEDATISHALKGLVWLRNSDNLVVRNTVFENIGGDGMNIANASNVVVEDSKFHKFLSNGKYHQDGIQAWKAADNIRIVNNHIEGPMMGITDFGSKGDPEVTRYHIEGNTLRIGTYVGISLTSSLNSVVKNNDVAGTAWPKRTHVRLHKSTITCGNIVRDFDYPDIEAPCGR